MTHEVFSQTIVLECSDPSELVALIEQWDIAQSMTDIMGYMGTRVLADRAHPGRYLVFADFGVVDPDVSAADEAAHNNDRAETGVMVAAVTAILDRPPDYANFDELYRTDL